MSVLQSVRPSIHLHGTTRLPLDVWSWNLTFEYFLKICREYSCFIKIWQEQWVLDMKTNIHFWSYLTQFFSEWKILQTEIGGKIKTHILYSIFLYCAVFEIMWKNIVQAGRQATDDSMTHVHCMLDTQVYRHTLRICTNYRFFHSNNDYTNMPQCHVICKLPAFLNFS